MAYIGDKMTTEIVRYNVQCLNGHVYQAPVGSDLERRCKEYFEKGFLDALCLSYLECRDCISEHEERERKMAEWEADWPDPF